MMVFLAWMMFSRFKYPSFKGFSWRSTRSLPKFVGILIVVVLTAMNFEWMPAVIFIAYLFYGFLRPFLSREMKRDIEEDVDEDEVVSDSEVSRDQVVGELQSGDSKGASGSPPPEAL